jgi:hypothetical protein
VGAATVAVMTWPLDKLSLINQSLVLSSDNPVNVADDGSDEWNVASAGYEAAIEYMFENHDWTPITRIQTLNPVVSPVGTIAVPEDDQFDTAYAKPPDCIHLIWVRLNDQPVVYRITGNRIEVSAIGGSSISNPPPANATPGVITVKYVSSDPDGNQTDPATKMSRTFFTALRKFVMSAIYRGLHEDVQESRALEAEAIRVLQEARTRTDQEQTKRAVFNSRIYGVRRVRKPFPQVPTGWGNTGIPG